MLSLLASTPSLVVGDKVRSQRIPYLLLCHHAKVTLPWVPVLCSSRLKP